MAPTPGEYEPSLSRASLTTTLPELLIVAEKLPEEVLRIETLSDGEQTPNSARSPRQTPPLATSLPQLLMVAEKLPEVLPQAEIILPTKTLITKENVSTPDTPKYEPRSDIFYEFSEDRISTSRLGTVFDLEGKAEGPKSDIPASKFQFPELQPPSHSVSSMFIVMYCLLGATIMMLIVLTILSDISMLLLLSVTIIIFVLIVIVTNICVMIYQV